MCIRDREANRLFGFTAKQTLDYAQQLYEKKLLTYPRTDSQYLTDDMQPAAESIVSGLWPLLPFAAGLDIAPQFGRVLNSKKVSDHHAIIPTMEFVQKGFDGLTEGEKKLLSLVCCKLLCACLLYTSREVLEAYHREYRCSYFLITHDMKFAYRLSQRIYELESGQIVNIGQSNIDINSQERK